MENHNDTNECEPNNRWGFIGGFLVGGVVGTLTMLLVAPQSGKRTRAKIQLRSIELRDKATDTIEDVLEQTRDKAQQIKHSVNDQADAIQQRGKDLVQEQKERFSTILESGSMAVQGVLSSRIPDRWR